MFKLKVMIIIVCIIMLILTYTFVRDDEKPDDETEEDDSVTFYDLIMDFDTSKLDFISYEPGDIVTVKDRISETEIWENISLDHNGEDYEYSVNIWMDSMNELSDYLINQPTLTVVGDHNKTTIESNFKVGDDVTIHFIVRSWKSESIYDKPTRCDECRRSSPGGLKIVNVAGTLNDERSEVEEISIKTGLLAGSTDFNIHDTIIEISWEDDGGKSGETTLLNHNNTEFCHEILEFKEIEDSPRIYIKETIFDHMEKTIPSDINIFWYDTLRDMKEYTTSDGILTPGDIINIFFNFTHFSNPPTGGGLNPGSCVQIKLIPKHGVPTLEQFYVPETFPKEGEWIQL